MYLIPWSWAWYIYITEFGSLCVDAHMCQVGTAADGNLSTQEAEKGGYIRLDYSLYRGKLCLSRKEKKK